MERLVNLTPHVIKFHTADGDFELAPDERGPARIVERPNDALPVLCAVVSGQGYVEVKAYAAGIPVEVSGLPPPKPVVSYIVSRMVLDSPLVADRRDLVAPGTGPTDQPVRDERGQVVAVTRLIRIVRARDTRAGSDYGAEDPTGMRCGPLSE